MTVKQVVEEIIIPTTKDKKCSFIDQLRPNMCVAPHAFVSHAFGNPFSIIVETLMSYFKDAVYSEVYVWIDIFIINQHNPGDDLHGGQTLKDTIEASGAVVVCLDKNTLPLFRLWCLYEIARPADPRVRCSRTRPGLCEDRRYDRRLLGTVGQGDDSTAHSYDDDRSKGRGQ